MDIGDDDVVGSVVGELEKFDDYDSDDDFIEEEESSI